MGPAHLHTGTYRADRFGEEVTISRRGPGLRLAAPGLALADVALASSRRAGRSWAASPSCSPAPTPASDLRGHIFVGARVE
ncbi:hypothetical protein OV203_01290 [Nannocystis sp. ILAH1]|uniref:hypothetical protein n=1 Tax=Nannocystis sp. ILAH1 TaxID=2996789 RepID=UPI00226EA202|nr:hypothetical protein [Nannocystis sp. ILAH1]MCY0985744.1 hypothetical protein [Nannocystis sp. ILAH1]